MKIAVWFSCGAASAVAAKLTVDKYGRNHSVRVLNTPVAEESADNRRFLKDVEAWIKRPIELVTNPAYPENSAYAVWEHAKAMSFPLGAPCTLRLKKQSRQLWEKDNPVDWHVLGFTADEIPRHKRFTSTERENVLPILIDAGLTKQDCIDYLVAAGLQLPDAYERGYPNANCIGCVKATSPTYWNLVREKDPDVFASRAEQSRRLNVRLARVNNKRIFLDELPPHIKGRKLKTPECGIFCEERKTHV